MVLDRDHSLRISRVGSNDPLFAAEQCFQSDGAGYTGESADVPDDCFNVFLSGGAGGSLSTDLDEIGKAYFGAVAEEISQWLQREPEQEPIGVCFSGGIGLRTLQGTFIRASWFVDASGGDASLLGKRFGLRSIRGARIEPSPTHDPGTDRGKGCAPASLMPVPVA